MVIGGGVIAMEFASIFRHVGSQVTVLEALPAILRGHRRFPQVTECTPLPAIWEVIVNGECEPATSSIPTLIRVFDSPLKLWLICS